MVKYPNHSQSLTPNNSQGLFSAIKLKTGLQNLYLKRKWLISAFILCTCVFIYLKPQQFADLWLTRDQQGQVLFNLAYYQKASNTFSNTQWQAYSNYGAEQFNNAVTLYGQFDDVASQVAQANALAQGRNYIKARNLYQQILNENPGNIAAKTNIVIVQAIIDEVNRLSESQQVEKGDSSQELGDEPQTGDGADKKEPEAPKELEQYSAEDLLLDPSLNEMWLRDVQKNPANFLAKKFYMQQQISQYNNEKSGDDTSSNQGDTND
ncbi:hypothetical protein [Colwellia echini]|uniref:Uncharacterized protein n=1 Tax=Colwellia echini TaxID=1982103 RepID=A0ABY3MUG1_9GAMM|nr:hypothetical protein [Colwellia echini]TYK64850.1 hypothetical protein CWS31_013615 [Colwellia echini]